jgi:hypothetical protein
MGSYRSIDHMHLPEATLAYLKISRPLPALSPEAVWTEEMGSKRSET